MESEKTTLLQFVIKTTVTHTVTYFILGVISFFLLDYSARYSGSDLAGFLRPTSDRLVMAGPLLQPIRGVLLGLAVFPFRRPLLERPKGWMLIWALLLVVGVFSPYVAAPGSLEGLIYTTIPLSFHLLSLPEVILQTALFSAILIHWVKNPQKRWLTWVMAVAFVLILLFPALGLLVPQP